MSTIAEVGRKTNCYFVNEFRLDLFLTILFTLRLLVSWKSWYL